MRTHLPERNLDVLRAVAVLCVVLDHFAWPFQHGMFWAWGTFGVFLFFVHTSLVLMASLERLDGQTETTGQLVSAFYLRRAFRIYPLAWAALALVIAAHVPTIVQSLPPHTTPYVPPTVGELVTNLTLTQNVGPQHRSLLGPLWSLPIEVQMYVLLPVLWWVARRNDRGRMLACVIAGAIPLGLIAHYGFPQWPLIWRTPNVLYYAPCFLGGILAYRLLRDRQRSGATAPVPAWAWSIALLATAFLFWAAHPTSLDNVWRGWVACLGLGAMIPFVRELGESWLTRAAKQVATYSYGIYLLHVPAQWVGMVLLDGFPWVVRWGVTLALLVALPVLAYHLIEAPAIRWGQRIAQPLLTSHRVPRGSTSAATATAP